jgi:hypothetical protein
LWSSFKSSITCSRALVRLAGMVGLLVQGF